MSRFIPRRANEAREREERDRVIKEQWRRQEEARLNALPVSARIIVQPQKPKVISRIGGFDIDFSVRNISISSKRRSSYKCFVIVSPTLSVTPLILNILVCE